MIFCYLSKRNNKRKPKDFTTCNKNYNFYNNLEYFEHTYGEKNFEKILETNNFIRLVRNPIERLISGFMHLCYYGTTITNEHYCYGCDKNITCFVNVLENKLWETFNNNFYLENNKENEYIYHFYPQTWSCEYYKLNHLFTYIKYNSSDRNTYSKNINEFLKKNNVNQHALSFINKKIHKFKTQHMTLSKNETTIYKDALYNDPFLLQKVCSIYYYDFIEFDFEFPKECINLTNINLNNRI
ncbi:Sulfotransferase family-containing protein [Strongyloides ratti]|uniref:Sulfotransferase family-containing protein n=1 Tax=Strongyloides ratti TaxID=34506 RepID=A0A090N0C4_STRRB|nr:Sulfotransferase family-containing protein [Strongyloides ratti]CEF70442.1 Sulfotransferase family-containing protein [Strongyloides ratti]